MWEEQTLVVAWTIKTKQKKYFLGARWDLRIYFFFSSYSYSRGLYSIRSFFNATLRRANNRDPLLGSRSHVSSNTVWFFRSDWNWLLLGQIARSNPHLLYSRSVLRLTEMISKTRRSSAQLFPPTKGDFEDDTFDGNCWQRHEKYSQPRVQISSTRGEKLAFQLCILSRDPIEINKNRRQDYVYAVKKKKGKKKVVPSSIFGGIAIITQ